jgi:hypothetical protein
MPLGLSPTTFSLHRSMPFFRRYEALFNGLGQTLVPENLRLGEGTADGRKVGFSR